MILIKKSQISLFLILGVILLFVAGVGFYFIGSIKEDRIIERTANVQQMPADFLPIKSYIDTCLRDSSASAAYRIGLKGGYNVLPFDFYESDYADLPYFYKRKGQVPSKKTVENELEELLKLELEDCVDFSLFEQQGFNISAQEAMANTSILKNKIVVNLDFPVKVVKGDLSAELLKFNYEIPFRLGHIMDISKELVDKIEKEPYYTDLTFLLGKDLDISVINSQDCNEIYLFYDNHTSNSRTSNYLFLFAVKIDEQYCDFRLNEDESFGIEENADNSAPVLDPIRYATASINNAFIYNITASDPDNDRFFFLDDTDLFQIHPLKGTIDFMPKENHAGLHKINITIVDINGAIDSRWFYLEVK